MNTYRVAYLKDKEQSIAYIQSNSEGEAGKRFKEKYSDIAADSILSVENLIAQNNNYATSIAISKFISFVGWIAVAGGILLTLIILMREGMVLLGLSPGITIVLVGFILVISGQVSRAVMDNANYSKSMLEVMIKNN